MTLGHGLAETNLTDEMIDAGIAAYADFLGDSRPIQMPEGERALVATIFRAMSEARERAFRE